VINGDDYNNSGLLTYSTMSFSGIALSVTASETIVTTGLEYFFISQGNQFGNSDLLSVSSTPIPATFPSSPPALPV
jgi:hypothetical protein